MGLGIYKQQQRNELVEKAVALYKSGLTFREVARVLNRSHEWVRKAYLSTVSDQKS